MNLLEKAVAYLGFNEKLGTHKYIIAEYNNITPLPRNYKMKSCDAWCMAYVSACAWQAGRPARFPYECSCNEAVQKLIKEGLWIENDAFVPSPMDLVFYHWGNDKKDDCTATPNHVGIVAWVKDGMITVIEGNYKDMVCYRDILVNDEYIRGYGQTSKLWKYMAKDNTAIAQEVIAGKWGNGGERRERLKAAGYNPDAIQAIVNAYYEDENPIENDYTVSEIAMQCIRGMWGNGSERRRRLLDKGYNPDAVQEMINNYYERG